jgi:tetratricopeptide (TPR) repeat protein
VLGRDHPDVARSLNNLADLYERQGRYGDAEPLYQRAAAIREAALGANNPDAAISLNNLASLYRTQGRTADALPIMQ